MIYARSFTSVALIWLFMMAFPLAYDIFRKDPDSTTRQDITAALGASALVVVVAALFFALLGFP